MSDHKPRTDRRRARTTPEWLLERKDLDDIARRRCLMILSVLSGELAVTDAIAEAKISRGTYYQLEERALKAMLAALLPGGEQAPSESPAVRIAELERKLATLERHKRRSERLLLLTRKVLKPGTLKSAAGRPRRSKRSSTSTGPKSSRGSKTEVSSSSPSNPSIPKKDGEIGP